MREGGREKDARWKERMKEREALPSNSEWTHIIVNEYVSRIHPPVRVTV